MLNIEPNACRITNHLRNMSTQITRQEHTISTNTDILKDILDVKSLKPTYILDLLSRRSNIHPLFTTFVLTGVLLFVQRNCFNPCSINLHVAYIGTVPANFRWATLFIPSYVIGLIGIPPEFQVLYLIKDTQTVQIMRRYLVGELIKVFIPLRTHGDQKNM